MKRILLLPFLLLALLISTSAFGQDYEPEWIVGTWKMETPRVTIYESWTRTADGHYTGEGFYYRNEEKVIRETLELVLRDGTWYYIPTVPDQNDGQAVSFTCVSASEKELIFENKEHDFPQSIRYELQDATHLLAEISGTINGKLRTEQFAMELIETPK